MGSTQTSTGRILLVEHHVLLADVLGRMLTDKGFAVKTTANIEEARALAANWHPSTALVDLPKPENVASVVEYLTQAGVVALVLTSDLAAPELADYLDLGAAGFVSLDSSFEHLMGVMAALAAGEQVVTLEQRYRIEDARRARAKAEMRLVPFRSLTDREAQVLDLLICGKTASEIADENYVSVSTVRTQIRSILNKLDVRSQLAAVALARESSWSE